MKRSTPNVAKGILSVIILTLLTWLLIHVLAAIGVLFAIALPLWWYIFRERTPCLACLATPQGNTCLFCGHDSQTTEGKYPRNIRSVILNCLTILLFSVVSLGIVWLEYSALERTNTASSHTVDFTVPTQSQHVVGEVFPLAIELEGINSSINAVQADLSFDPDLLEVREISTEHSFATIFVEKIIDNEHGFARLSGGLPNPGFSGEMGTFGTIYFAAKKTGVVEVTYLPSSMVLRNDGLGSSIVSDFATISYFILPESSDTESHNSPETLDDNTEAVIGEQTESTTQFTFFEDTDSTYLLPNTEVTSGSSLPEDIAQTVSQTPAALASYDRYIIRIWKELLRFDGQKDGSE
jgi:hypothetical protein